MTACSRCDMANSSDSRFCDACGASLQPACPVCGHSNRPKARFCGGCGGALTGAEAARAEPAAPALPAPLAALLSARFAREGERKRVTVLFADIRGSTELIEELDPEQAMQRLEPGLQAMVEAVHRYGGIVNYARGDGIMALFGAPIAVEDHAVRACLAARAMLDAVARLGEDFVEIRVGLNSGEVVVRSVGRDLSMEYDAVGPTTHLASRMEQAAAPGTACLTAHTARLAAGFIQVRPRGPIEIKGISRPVEVFELAGVAGRNRWQVRAAARDLSRFVGRETQMRLLSDAWHRVEAGRGQVVAVSGEAGMGKSRLVHEFLADLAPAGTPHLGAAAVPHDLNTPYQLVAQMLRTWLGVDDADGRAEIEAKLAAAAEAIPGRGPGPGADPVPDLAPLRSILDLPVRDAGWEALDTVQRRLRTRDAVRSLVLRLAAAAPLVVLVEDMHWADPESRAVLECVVDALGAARVLVVVTYRPEYQNGWARHSYYTLVQLGPLGGAASDMLLRDLIDPTSDLEALRRRMVEQADGTPLFLEEMARTLVETGVLVSEPPRFRLTRAAAEVDIPTSVQIVLASRIDRLPPEERALLQVASVIGKDVPVALLRAVARVPADRLARQILHLESLEFLHEVAGSSGAAYSFKHALTHAVAYDGMLVRHRRALHAEALSAIEEHFPDRLDEFTERLAEHAARGEVWDKAALYAFKAGERANARSAHRAAAASFERALDAVGRLPMSHELARRAIDIRLGLRVALVATGELERVRLHLQDAESLARLIGDERRLMPILISRSTILNNLGALDEAVEAGLRGRALAERAKHEDCLISAGFALGQAHWNRGDFRAAEEALYGVIEAAGAAPKRNGGTTGTASVLCLVSLSHTHSLTGDAERAFVRAAEALAVAAETRRPYDLSYAHAARGLAHLTFGAFDGAVRDLEEALRIARSGEIALLIPHAARYLGRAYALTGRTDEAEALLAETVGQTTEQSLPALRGWCNAALGLARLLGGDPDAAEAAVSEAREFARRYGYRPLEAHATRLLGVIEASRRGDAASGARAEAWLRCAARLAGELGMKPELAHCRLGLAGVLARAGHEAEAHAERAEAAALYDEIGMTGDAAAALAVVESPAEAPARPRRSPLRDHPGRSDDPQRATAT